MHVASRPITCYKKGKRMGKEGTAVRCTVPGQRTGTLVVAQAEVCMISSGRSTPNGADATRIMDSAARSNLRGCVG